jgi:hypothetical protein
MLMEKQHAIITHQRIERARIYHHQEALSVYNLIHCMRLAYYVHVKTEQFAVSLGILNGIEMPTHRGIGPRKVRFPPDVRWYLSATPRSSPDASPSLLTFRSSLWCPTGIALATQLSLIAFPYSFFELPFMSS